MFLDSLSLGTRKTEIALVCGQQKTLLFSSVVTRGRFEFKPRALLECGLIYGTLVPLFRLRAQLNFLLFYF
jgi:hypothetical protein